MDENDVEFSYITTSLGYTSITEWLGLEDKKDFDSDDIDEDNLKNLFAWCFVRDLQGRTIIRESRRLKDIARIVDNDDAVRSLVGFFEVVGGEDHCHVVLLSGLDDVIP